MPHVEDKNSGVAAALFYPETVPGRPALIQSGHIISFERNPVSIAMVATIIWNMGKLGKWLLLNSFLTEPFAMPVGQLDERERCSLK